MSQYLNAYKATMQDAQRIAQLAWDHGGEAFQWLWDIAEFAQDEQVRAYAERQATQPGMD